MVVAHLPHFARLLRHYRIEAELTQEELAERARISPRTISDLERGVKLKPHRVTVELLADALHLSLEDRAALLEAVPPRNGVPADALPALPTWLPGDPQARLVDAQAVPCPRELRQVLDGLLALYVKEDIHDRQINVTVIMFSVPGSSHTPKV